MKDLIDLEVGTKFYLPPIKGLWSGETYSKDGELYVKVLGNEEYNFKLERGKYIVGANVRLGEMPSYSFYGLANANY